MTKSTHTGLSITNLYSWVVTLVVKYGFEEVPNGKLGPQHILKAQAGVGALSKKVTITHSTNKPPKIS